MKLQLRADDKMPWGRYKEKTLREIFEELPEYYDYILTLDTIFISSETQKILKSNKKTKDVTILEYQCKKETTYQNKRHIYN